MKYDVIVVLAGGIKDDGSLSDTVKRRIKVAKEHFDHGFASYVLMSGKWSKYREKNNPPITEAEAMKRFAINLGIPLEKILKEEQSTSTFENAQYTHRLFLQPRNWKKIIVVTSDFHLPRSKKIFTKVLGDEFQVKYMPSSTRFSLGKWLMWWIKEALWFMKFKN